MFGLIADWYRAKRREFQLASDQSRLLEGYLSNLSRPYVDTELEFLGATGSLSPTIPRHFTEARTVSRNLYKTNPFARNVVTQIVNHVVGRGFKLKFDDEIADDAWRVVARNIRWPRRRREIVRRTLVDGSCLLRRFEGSRVRFVELEELKDAQYEGKRYPHGVVYDPEDIETILAYNIGGEIVDAKDVFHFKILDSDFNDIFGWPPLAFCKQYFEDYYNFVKDRGILNRYRSSILMMKKYKNATKSVIDAAQAAARSGTFTKYDGKQASYMLSGNGPRVVEHGDDIEYEFKAPNVGGQDASEDGRAMRLLIAVFFSFAEYITTSDASNANFASTAVSESPSVKTMESYQSIFGEDVCDFVRWLLDREDLSLECTYPSIVVRDELQLSQSRQIQHDAGVLSTATWQELEGLDPDTENERIENPI